MAVKRNDHRIGTPMARALELTEEALGQVARIAIEEIHSGLESSNHVQAAERDMRSALRQLVLAERELLRARPAARAASDERSEDSASVPRQPGADARRVGNGTP